MHGCPSGSGHRRDARALSDTNNFFLISLAWTRPVRKEKKSAYQEFQGKRTNTGGAIQTKSQPWEVDAMSKDHTQLLKVGQLTPAHNDL